MVTCRKSIMELCSVMCKTIRSGIVALHGLDKSPRATLSQPVQGHGHDCDEAVTDSSKKIEYKLSAHFTMLIVLLSVLASIACVTSTAGTARLGEEFELSWTESSLTVLNTVRGGPPIWQTYKDVPFLRLGDASVPRPPVLNGNYQLLEETLYLSDRAVIDDVEDGQGPTLTVIGRLFDTASVGKEKFVASYKLEFEKTGRDQLRFHLNVFPDETSVAEQPLSNPRIFLTYRCERDENFYGFGESFSFFNLKGRNVPILVSEQGVGRGEQPITDTLNRDVAEGVGGSWYTTYAPKPIYITDYNRTFMLTNSEVSFFNLTHSGGAVPRVQVELWSLQAVGYVAQTASMLDAVEAVTAVTGRMTGLPEWTQQGAIVGLEGGAKNVTEIVDRMYEAGVPMAGIWLQDWVGLQHSWDGDRLIWNWELNKDHYPGWAEMTGRWKDRGTRVLTYMSPFFSDPSAYSDSTTAFRHNFFREGVENGYFVQNANGTTYLMYSLSIKFAMLDLTNPAAVRWMQDIIIDQSVDEAGSSGWMCDFGEYLPFDAVLLSGEPAASYHNRYPEEWGKLTQAALTEAAARRHRGGTSGSQSAIDPADVMYFMRSAWIQSPRYAPVFWLGDQLVSWDSKDGIRSAITGALSSGLVGHSITHSDIGGYNVELDLGDDMYYVRTPELLQRWSEMAAFGFGLFRTHIGSSTTPLNAQVYDTPESMAHFARFAAIYAQQAPYRKQLMQEAADRGYPLLRHMCLHYGYDEAVWDLGEQYLVGTQFLVAPVVYEGATSVQVYFPRLSGPWVHIWSGNVVTPTDPDRGLTVTVPAPMGFPPVFYQQGSAAGEELRAFLIVRGYTEGYEWEYQPGQLQSPQVGAAEGVSVKGDTGSSQDAVPFAVLLAGATVLLVVAARLFYLRSRSTTKPDSLYVDGDSRDTTDRLLSQTEVSDARL